MKVAPDVTGDAIDPDTLDRLPLPANERSSRASTPRVASPLSPGAPVIARAGLPVQPDRRLRTSSSHATRSTRTGGCSAAAPATASSTGRRSAEYVAETASRAAREPSRSTRSARGGAAGSGSPSGAVGAAHATPRAALVTTSVALARRAEKPRPRLRGSSRGAPGRAALITGQAPRTAGSLRPTSRRVEGVAGRTSAASSSLETDRAGRPSSRAPSFPRPSAGAVLGLVVPDRADRRGRSGSRAAVEVDHLVADLELEPAADHVVELLLGAVVVPVPALAAGVLRHAPERDRHLLVLERRASSAASRPGSRPGRRRPRRVA